MVQLLSPPLTKLSEKDVIKETWRCRTNFLHFLQSYVWIQDRAGLETVKWEPWAYLVWLAKWLLRERFILIGKARQLGVSWLICAYCVWKAKFYENAKILMLSQGEEEAYDLIKKCKFIDNHLPDFLQTKRDPDQSGFIGFPHLNSEIKALASTEKAGRSTDASIVFCDEWEYHPYAEQNFAALLPTVSGGGQFIGASTADKTKIDTFFKRKYHEATLGRSNFKKIFLPWHIRPGRDEVWLEYETKDMASWQKEGEFPATEDDMLTTLKTRKFFGDISERYLDVREPIKHELSDKFPSVKIYKLPVVGGKYCLFCDPSDGKEDPHVIIVVDRYKEQVAESHGRTTADINALIFDSLVRLYNNAFNSYELNGRAGGIFSEKLKELNVPNQSGQLKADGKLDNKKTGWWSYKTSWNTMIWGLEENVRLRQTVIRNKECLDEFNQFIVPEGEDPQKVRGGHDDYVDGWRGVLHLLKYVPSDGMRISTAKYRG